MRFLKIFTLLCILMIALSACDSNKQAAKSDTSAPTEIEGDDDASEADEPEDDEITGEPGDDSASEASDDANDANDDDEQEDNEQDSNDESDEESADAAQIETGEPHPALLKPELANATAPATFKLKFDTTKGDFVMEVTREWAPNGADRLYNLAKIGYFSDIAFFRVISGFMVQFGIHGDPNVARAWREASIQDDPVTQSNRPGYVTFATAGPNTRTTQLFINYGNNQRLDNMGFAPLGRIIEGMDVVRAIYSGYGEGAPAGRGPAQGRLQAEGNTYLKADFPEMDYIKSVSIIED